MDLTFQSIINIIFFVGALQGFILTGLLYSIKTNVISNRLLGILTSFWAIILLVFALQFYGIHNKYPHLLNTFSQLMFAWFPLLFLSVKYLIKSYSHFQKKDLLHFIPMVISILLFLDFYSLSGEEKIEMVRNPSGIYEVASLVFEEMLAIQGVVYSVLALLLLNSYRKRVVDFHANVDIVLLKGIRIGVLLSLIAWIIGIVGIILDRAELDPGFDIFLFVYLFFVAIIYIISIIALRSGEVYKLKGELASELFAKEANQSRRYSKESETNVQERTKELSVKEEEFESVLNKRLISYMENSKPYLNPDFNLQVLSDYLLVSRHQLSSTINTKQKMNFFEFVNSYRVNEVKKLMSDEAKSDLKNYELAFEAGFNSKATFYRIFKQMTGQTPSDYREMTGDR